MKQINIYRAVFIIFSISITASCFSPVRLAYSPPEIKDSIVIGRFTPREQGNRSSWVSYSFFGAMRTCYGVYDEKKFRVDHSTGFYAFRLPKQTDLEIKYGQPFKTIYLICKYDYGNTVYLNRIKVVEKRFDFAPGNVLVFPEIIFDYTSNKNHFPSEVKVAPGQDSIQGIISEFKSQYPRRVEGNHFEVLGKTAEINKKNI